jgi:hypothetical protein
MELFANWLQPNTPSDSYKTGVMLGIMAAMVICGLIPLVVGLKSGHPIVGTIGAFATGGVSFFLGCIGGLPVAFVFSVLIRAMGSPPVDEERLRDQVERQRRRNWEH